MTPPEPAELRKARQFAFLRELGELAMNVARASAQAATEAFEQTPGPDAPDQPRAAEHALTFARASRAVRQTIALEMRLAAEDQPHRGADNRPRYTACLAPDPRRAPLRQVLHDVVAPEATDAVPRRPGRRFNM